MVPATFCREHLNQLVAHDDFRGFSEIVMGSPSTIRTRFGILKHAIRPFKNCVVRAPRDRIRVT